jgi:hypothetical protein
VFEPKALAGAGGGRGNRGGFGGAEEEVEEDLGKIIKRMIWILTLIYRCKVYESVRMRMDQ